MFTYQLMDCSCQNSNMQACNVLNTFQNFSFGQPMHIMISKQNKKYFFNVVSKSFANSFCWIDDLPTHSYMHEWQLYPQEKSLLSPWCQNLLMCYPMNSKRCGTSSFIHITLTLPQNCHGRCPLGTISTSCIFFKRIF